jgi:hypothetical protein
MVVAWFDLAGATNSLKVVLQRRQEKSGAVGRRGLAGDYITGADAQPVVIRSPAYVIVRIKFRICANEQNVLCGTEFLADAIDHFRRADRQFHFQRFPACVIVPSFGSDTQICLRSGIAPLRHQFRGRGVTLEVVRQDDGRVVADVLIAGVT